MPEYIEREATLREIERREALMVGDKLVSVDGMKTFIKNRPAADVAPVRHGRWIELEPEIGLFECNLCGHKIIRAKCNYCPNCGARCDK